MTNRQYYVYILMNAGRTTSYIGVTNNLTRRVLEHKQKLIKGFTEKYNLNMLVYYEIFQTAYDAISREKQLKGWSRQKKISLIQNQNLHLDDLSETL